MIIMANEGSTSRQDSCWLSHLERPEILDASDKANPAPWNKLKFKNAIKIFYDVTIYQAEGWVPKEFSP